jgi:hypothetical protein
MCIEFGEICLDPVGEIIPCCEGLFCETRNGEFGIVGVQFWNPCFFTPANCILEMHKQIILEHGMSLGKHTEPSLRFHVLVFLYCRIWIGGKELK